MVTQTLLLTLIASYLLRMLLIASVVGAFQVGVTVVVPKESRARTADSIHKQSTTTTNTKLQVFSCVSESHTHRNMNRSVDFVIEAITNKHDDDDDAPSSILWEFLRIAAHEDDVRTVQSNPKLARYVADFDPNQDIGFIARIGQEPVGAIWTRLWNDDPISSGTTSTTTSRRKNRGFAFVSNTIPELAVAVKPEYHQRGIGAALLQRLLNEVATHHHTSPAPCGVSLSVRDSNTVALRMYQNAGFQHLWSSPNRVGGLSYTMVKLFDETTVILRSEFLKNDIPTILSLIQKKAAFDRTMADSITTLTVTEEKLEAALLRDKRAHVVLAEQQGTAIGMALYYFRFSSFAGQPSLWLEDLFVEHEWRTQGVGQMLMEHLAVVATTHNCTHIGWTASERNVRGLAFYERLGATIVDQTGTTCTLKWVIDNE